MTTTNDDTRAKAIAAVYPKADVTDFPVPLGDILVAAYRAGQSAPVPLLACRWCGADGIADPSDHVCQGTLYGGNQENLTAGRYENFERTTIDHAPPAPVRKLAEGWERRNGGEGDECLHVNVAGIFDCPATYSYYQWRGVDVYEAACERHAEAMGVYATEEDEEAGPGPWRWEDYRDMDGTLRLMDARGDSVLRISNDARSRLPSEADMALIAGAPEAERLEKQRDEAVALLNSAHGAETDEWHRRRLALLIAIDAKRGAPAPVEAVPGFRVVGPTSEDVPWHPEMWTLYLGGMGNNKPRQHKEDPTHYPSWKFGKFLVVEPVEPAPKAEAPVCEEWCGTDRPALDCLATACFANTADPPCWCSPACRDAGRPVNQGRGR